MEQNDSREIIMTVAEEIFAEPNVQQYPYLGVVIQAYLHTAQADIERIIRLAQRRGPPLTVRLVKGAYWDYEVVLTKQRHWSIPVFLTKAETDENYERCVDMLFSAYPSICPAFGSHNVRSLSYAISVAENKSLSKTAFEMQMLYGMAEPFKKALVDMDYRVREYAPVGELLPGMAYLVRRLLENTSNESFLRATFVGNVDHDTLLLSPSKKHMWQSSSAPHAGLQMDKSKKEIVSQTFANEPFQDFAIAENRKAVEDALERLRMELPLEIPVVVNGEVSIGHILEKRKELEKVGKQIMPIGINDHLRLMGQDKNKHAKPYHRTLTTAY